MYRDESKTLLIAPIVGPIVLSADNTPAAIDLLGAGSNTILIAVGVGGITFSGTNKIEFKLTHCDTEAGTYTAVDASHVILGENCDAAVTAGGIVRSLIAAHAAETVAKLGYVGGKRYIKVLADFSGTHGSGTPIAVSVVKSRLHLQPAY